MGFDDWRTSDSTARVHKFDVEKIQADDPSVDWYNPTTWGNSYLFDTRAPYISPLNKEEEAQRLQDEGRYFYTRDLGGDGTSDLTPLQRHALWLEGRDTSDRGDTMFGYDTDEVLASAAANEGLDITVFRDAILLEAAEQYYNKNASDFQYESPIGPPGPNSIEAYNYFNDPANRSGSGSGSRGPQYVAPDRRQVEEYVGDKMIVLTGKRQPELSKFVDAYLADAKAAFEGASVDPAMGVLENIRGTAEYKRIHTLRDEATDENTWVNRRQQRLEQLGLSSAQAGGRGIELAATGANLNDIDTGKLQTARGRKDITLMNTIEQTAKTIGGLL